LPISVFEKAQEIPTLLAISPNGPWGVQDLWRAGGMPAVMKVMQDSLNVDCMTVIGHPLSLALEFAQVKDAAVIPPRDKPHRDKAGIAILRGNIAPDSCVVKQAGVSESMLSCSGKARCYDSEELALKAIYADEVSAGEVVVLRYQGPKGGPGMPEMLGVTMALKEKGLKETALITDGRFSGATSGPCIGHICPEASDGGMIAFVEDGDLIEIDIPNNRIHLQVSDEEIERRRQGWQPLVKPVPAGFMQRYRKHVRPACEGAILS